LRGAGAADVLPLLAELLLFSAGTLWLGLVLLRRNRRPQ
jgi:hypothetical protein